MSTDYMNANDDLDWVQAPPQAFIYENKSRRKYSNNNSGSRYKGRKYNNGDEYWSQKKPKAQSKYSKKKKPSYY